MTMFTDGFEKKEKTNKKHNNLNLQLASSLVALLAIVLTTVKRPIIE